MGQPSASRQQATWLGWIPLPALLLACDGSAVAANERWADLSPVPGDGQGWLKAVEPWFRPALRATLLLAAATGEPGSADCPVTGPPGGRRGQWWWQPFPPGGLVVCVAVADDDPAGRARPVAGDTRDLLAQEHSGAELWAGISADLAMAAVQRIFEAGLALDAAASLLPWPAATLVLRVLDDLDQLVRDVRNAAFKPPASPVGEQELPPMHAVIPDALGHPKGFRGSWTDLPGEGGLGRA